MLYRFAIANLIFCCSQLCGNSAGAAQPQVTQQTERQLIYPSPKNPEEGLERLIKGNERYSKDESICPDRNQERRAALSSKQKPFAVIVGCSDSRVAPEIIFDQGVGDLFVVRNAGNVIGKIESESILYAVEHLKASVILVLGHENCGAVTAVVEGQTQDIPALDALIGPAVSESKSLKGNAIENAIKMNVHQGVENLKSSKEFSTLVQQKKIIILGGYYNLHTGKIEILN